jgi:hypothetical protein
MLKSMRAVVVLMALMLVAMAQSVAAPAKPAAVQSMAAAYTECMKMDRLGDGSSYDCEWALHPSPKTSTAAAATTPIKRAIANVKNAAAPSSTVASAKWIPDAKAKAAYKACLTFERQGEELYIDCGNLLRPPVAAQAETAVRIDVAPAVQTAPTKKFMPSGDALAARASCLKMNVEHSGEEPYFDCDNFTRTPVVEATVKLASAKPARPEPNYFGEGCESGCMISFQ